ncbi:Lrp/AsnC family transcriptional regulator [Streptomyces sp. NPDC002573]|uniref:Lrp/AsnC family transcriptional regulator n=1 Tax=Streptomyces sp. NPDC002573 TaxID=3364651 RepID=UPI0036B04B37
MESDHYDEIDLRILHALHLDARASFSRIASVVGVSDQTVARRYARLRAEGSLRIWGLTDPSRLGHIGWLVRIRCTPDSAGDVASALARRTDTSWISRTAGGTELVCRTSAPTPADELLLKTLPRSARILDLSAHCLLHVFFGRSDSVITTGRPLPRTDHAAEPTDLIGGRPGRTRPPGRHRPPHPLPAAG